MTRSIKILIFCILLLLTFTLAIFGISKIKVDDFHKAAVVFIVDASASNQSQLTEQLKTLKQLCAMLDPEDHIKILRVSEDSYLIYEGSPQSSSEIRKSMEEFTKFDSKEYGTAYGLSLTKSFKHAINMHKEGYIPSVVVIGDLENEGDTSKQVNWDLLPQEVQKVKNQTNEFTMMFLYANPDKLDFVKEKLTPVLGENNLVIGTSTTANKSIRKFLTAIGR